MRLVNLCDQLRQLFPLAFAHVEKANADVLLVLDSLDDTAKPERQAFEMELGLDARVDADGKALFGANAAAAHAEIQDAAGQARRYVDEQNGGSGVDLVAGLIAAVAA